MKLAPRRLLGQEMPRPEAASARALRVRRLGLRLAGQIILRDFSFSLPTRGITMLIGPSGAGKSSLLRCLNGLFSQWSGEIEIAAHDVRRWPGGGDALRRYVGLLGQKPTPFPCSIYDNVVFGLRGWRRRRRAGSLAAESLRQAALWEEVRDRLGQPAAQLSIGQQQRLCLARALAVRPRLLLLDEPTASLDPRSTQLIEQALQALSRRIPLLWVSHDLSQVERLAQRVLFVCDGRLIEDARGVDFFGHPRRLESREFLRWNVCDCDMPGKGG